MNDGVYGKSFVCIIVMLGLLQWRRRLIYCNSNYRDTRKKKQNATISITLFNPLRYYIINCYLTHNPTSMNSPSSSSHFFGCPQSSITWHMSILHNRIILISSHFLTCPCVISACNSTNQHALIREQIVLFVLNWLISLSGINRERDREKKKKKKRHHTCRSLPN